MVVDNGSTDDTPVLATSAGATVVSHARNLGKGAALKTGLSAALTRGFEWGLTLDGDGQHKPQDVPAFLRCAGQTDARLVVGNRMHNPQAIPWLRRQVNRWMSRRLSDAPGSLSRTPNAVFGWSISRPGPACRLETDHFEIESEMLLAFIRAGYRVEFVPIQVVGRGRSSHIRPVADTLRWWKWWRDSIGLRRGRFKLEAPVLVRHSGPASGGRNRACHGKQGWLKKSRCFTNAG